MHTLIFVNNYYRSTKTIQKMLPPELFMSTLRSLLLFTCLSLQLSGRRLCQCLSSADHQFPPFFKNIHNFLVEKQYLTVYVYCFKPSHIKSAMSRNIPILLSHIQPFFFLFNRLLTIKKNYKTIRDLLMQYFFI